MFIFNSIVSELSQMGIKASGLLSILVTQYFLLGSNTKCPLLFTLASDSFEIFQGFTWPEICLLY